MKWNFKINFKHKPLPLALGSNITLRNMYWSWLRKESKQRSRDNNSSIEMTYSTLFIPHISHDWENMKISEFDFLLTKEYRKMFPCAILLLATITFCNFRTLKKPVNKNNIRNFHACDIHTSKLNMMCVDACAWYFTPFMARPET